MGDLEEAEPPLKRIKQSLGESNVLSSHCSDSSACSLGNQMARTLSSQADKQMVGTKGAIKREEFVKIITRALYTLGYEKTGALLEDESGISLHSSIVSLFMKQVLDGKWDESVATLRRMGISEENVRSASFIILEQKFLELLHQDNTLEALKTLRNEIACLKVYPDRVHLLASRVISSSKCSTSCQSPVGLSTRPQILERVQNLLPPSLIVPERRLEQLVEQALDMQRDSCAFHNSLDSELSLYTDHHCGRTQIPSRTLQILQGHTDEVWYLQFSHNGRYLASASKDQTAIIWEVCDDGHVTLKHKLGGHQRPVSTVSWSPDNTQLLTCGLEEVVRRWDVVSGECLQVYEKQTIGLISCGWFPDGKGVISGVSDKSISYWDLEGKEVECWRGQRTLKMSDMGVTGDGNRVLSLCGQSTILLHDREARLQRFIEEDQTITSFSLSKDDRFLLVNLLNQEIHLWNIESDFKLVAKYRGHKRARFLIRSCFGGFEQAFIASGSEDSQVYIWHRASSELLLALPGHSGAVNCVSWNPINPHMLASASDDRTVRIWGLDNIDLKCNGAAQSIGVIHLAKEQR